MKLLDGPFYPCPCCEGRSQLAEVIEKILSTPDAGKECKIILRENCDYCGGDGTVGEEWL